jgi:hypothetical protein
VPFQRIPHDAAGFRTFHRAFVGRLPGPIGCLVLLVLLPVLLVLGLVVGLVMLTASLLTGGRRRAAAPPSSPEAAAREEALRRLVRAMALDATFTADDARQAGTLVAGGATVDDLLADGLARRWIEVRGERLAVTRRGREELDLPAST